MNADLLTLAHEKTKRYELSNVFHINENKIDKDGINHVSSYLDTEGLQEIMNDFFDVTGLGVGLFDKKNEVVANAGLQKICSHFHQKNHETHKGCKQSEKFFKKNFSPNEAISYKCNNGLWDVAYPIYIGTDNIGNVRFGQFFYANEQIDKNFFITQAEKYGFDLEPYIEQLKQVPILEEKKVISSITLFLKVLGKMLK
jgi:ligand-binding sensor protein